MSVNVNCNVSDQFYGYKMPRLIAKVEGKGNGIKTVIVDMVDVAKALERPPTYPTKYLVVSWEHRPSLMLTMTVTLSMDLMRRISCKTCWMDSLKILFSVLSENPETDLHVNPKKQTMGKSCKACGYRDLLDTHHKLCTFILKTHLRIVTLVQGRKERKRKIERARTRKMALHPPVRHHHLYHHLRSVLHMRRRKRKMMMGGDTTEETQRCRMDEISDHAKGLTLSDDLKRTVRERVNILFEFVKDQKEEGMIDKEIVTEAERLDVKAMDPLVLTEVLFDKKIEQLKKYRHHFLRFCRNNKKAQWYLLRGLECVVAVHQAQLISTIPHILKEMYDADLLEEEVIIGWSEKASKKYISKELAKEIHDRAEPFIKWLKEAEEESSGGEEEDENENIEVVYSETASVPKVEPVKSDKDDDIDIDAI